MPYLNQAIVMGHLGRDPEWKAIGEAGKCTFSIATSRKWKDKAGEQQEHTEWHNIEVWGKSAEWIYKDAHKGSLVLVKGEIRTDKYTGKDGEEKRFTRIVADNFGGCMCLDKRNKDGAGEPDAPGGTSDITDDLPF